MRSDCSRSVTRYSPCWGGSTVRSGSGLGPLGMRSKYVSASARIRVGSPSPTMTLTTLLGCSYFLKKASPPPPLFPFTPLIRPPPRLPVLDLPRVRLRPRGPLVTQRQESLVHAVQRVALLCVVPPAQRGRALERHVLEDVRQAGDAFDFLHAAHIGVSEKTRHRRLMALHHDERHAVLQREAADARLDFLKAAGGGKRACHHSNQKQDSSEHGASCALISSEPGS